MDEVDVLFFDVTQGDVFAPLAAALRANESFRVRHERAEAAEAAAACSQLQASLPSDVVLFGCPGDAFGRLPPLVRTVALQPQAQPVVVATNAAEPAALTGLLQAGVSEYWLPPFDAAHLVPRLSRLVGDPPSGPKAGLRGEVLGRDGLVGESPAFLAALDKAVRAANSDVGVLILGETGTGKELCARMIHRRSSRGAAPFVPVNCGALPGELVENELFGHEPGAYTGAAARADGLIEQAEGGTLFLDEIDSMSLLAQGKLLRFLQDNEYRPLGSGKACRADVRIVAATNCPIEAALQNRRLRRDLYYRLTGVTLTLPPLRERGSDLVLLVRHFLRQGAVKAGRQVLNLSPWTLQKLAAYPWPGNVRELEHVIQQAALLARTGVLRPEDVDLPHHGGGASARSFRAAKAEAMARFEQQYVTQMLAIWGGNVSQAAQAAGKDRGAFQALMRKYSIQRDAGC